MLQKKKKKKLIPGTFHALAPLVHMHLLVCKQMLLDKI